MVPKAVPCFQEVGPWVSGFPLTCGGGSCPPGQLLGVLVPLWLPAANPEESGGQPRLERLWREPGGGGSSQRGSVSGAPLQVWGGRFPPQSSHRSVTVSPALGHPYSSPWRRGCYPCWRTKVMGPGETGPWVRVPSSPRGFCTQASCTRGCVCVSRVGIHFSKGICAFSSPWPHPGLVCEEEPRLLLFTAEDLLEEVRVKKGNERGGPPGGGIPGEEAAGLRAGIAQGPPRPWEGGEMRGSTPGGGRGEVCVRGYSVGDIEGRTPEGPVSVDSAQGLVWGGGQASSPRFPQRVISFASRHVGSA